MTAREPADAPRRRTRRAVLIVSVPFAAAGIATVTGVASQLLGEPFGVRRVVATLLIDWALLCVVIVSIAGLRHRRRQTVIACLSVAAAVGSFEALLRIGHPPSWRPLQKIPSAEYHHVNQPDRTMFQTRVDGVDVIVRTNADGLRSGYSRATFREHRHRIAVLGDSFTFGHGVRQDRAFPRVLEGLLRDGLGRSDIGVLNAGVISYSPFLARRQFEGIVRHYAPTLVLYVLDATDIGDDYNYPRELVQSGDRRAFRLEHADPPAYWGSVAQLVGLRRLVRRATAPVGWVDRLLGGRRRPAAAARPYDWYAFEAHIGGRLETDRYFIYRHSLEVTRRYFESTFDNLRQLASAVRREGGEFLLVVTPRYHHWNPAECPDNWEVRRGMYAVDEPHQYEYFRFFEQQEPSAPFLIFDLLAAFRDCEESPLVFSHDPHWNDSGHAFVAGVLHDLLIETGRVD